MIFVIDIIHKAIGLYSFLLIIYIFMSWVPSSRETKIGRFLEKICEPFLEPFRRFIPPLGMIDISPIVAILTLRLAATGVLSLANYI
ncbi:YggT family protein [Paenisporosarcina sp. TG20]|uniref:YggT family protein n=1 Tax=Paenisporosarcina sp. TG20 TaxID=1211706 RepID=UPI0002E80EDC|nr:YggT family protein [Paenisporosarcina sp. TG20]